MKSEATIIFIPNSLGVKIIQGHHRCRWEGHGEVSCGNQSSGQGGYFSCLSHVPYADSPIGPDGQIMRKPGDREFSDSLEAPPVSKTISRPGGLGKPFRPGNRFGKGPLAGGRNPGNAGLAGARYKHFNSLQSSSGFQRGGCRASKFRSDTLYRRHIQESAIYQANFLYARQYPIWEPDGPSTAASRCRLSCCTLGAFPER
jgi:hypothetical protein